MKTIRKWWYRYLLANARWDVKYWQSAIATAEVNLANAQARAYWLSQKPNEIDYPLPRVVRR